MNSLLPQKKDVCQALLIRGSVFIHLNPRYGQVMIPARLKNQPQVVLQIGWNMPVPIPDLRLDSEGVYGTLSFKGVPFTCYIPWENVFALVGEDAQGMVWQEEMPIEIQTEIARRNTNGADVIPFDKTAVRKTTVRRPARKLVNRPSYLMVVK